MGRRLRFQVAVRHGHVWRLLPAIHTRAEADRKVYSLFRSTDDAFHGTVDMFKQHGLPRGVSVSDYYARMGGRIPRHTVRQRLTFFPATHQG